MSGDLSFPTSLGTSTADEIRLLGQDLTADLMGKVGFGELAFWLATQRRPSRGETRVFEAVLAALAIQRRLQELAPETGEVVNLQIGISSGPLVMPRSTSQGHGSTGSPPPGRTSRCRCGPVERPELPRRPMSWPGMTTWPFLTEVEAMCP